jgi:hypothetical protein
MGTGQIQINPDAKQKTKKPFPRFLYAEN